MRMLQGIAKARLWLAGVAVASGVACASPMAEAQETSTRTSGNVTAYIGFLPAAMVQGHLAMHGRQSRGAGKYHLVAALFDASSSARIVDATVKATVAPLGLTGETRLLEAMRIDDTVSYGGFFTLAERGRYTIRLEVIRPGSDAPVRMEFPYDHIP